LTACLLADEHDRDNDRCKEWIVSHERGPTYWLRNLTKTENYHWREQGLQPVMPFPFKPFRDRVVDVTGFPFEHEFVPGKLCEKCAAYGFEYCQPDYLDVIMGFQPAPKAITFRANGFPGLWLTGVYGPRKKQSQRFDQKQSTNRTLHRRIKLRIAVDARLLDVCHIYYESASTRRGP